MIFIKIMISIVILLITSYIGIEMASALKEREEILTDYITFLRMVQNEMVYMSNSLPTSFEMARQKINSRLKDAIGAIVIDMSEYGANKIDASITENINNLDSLKPYDKELIISTLKNLGRSDLDSQNNIIENNLQIMQKQIKEANTLKIKSSKVYKTIGVITGLIIVVIFI